MPALTGSALLTLVTGAALVLSGCGSPTTPATGGPAAPAAPAASSTAVPDPPLALPAAAAVPAAAAGAAAQKRSAPHPEVVVALGDSVPAGAACGCTAYVSLIASQMSTRISEPVSAVNDAVSGSTSAGLLAMLDSASPTAADVARADVVIITTGANDFNPPPAGGAASCVTATSCYANTLQALTSNVGAIISRIRALRQGPPTTIVVTGYWNIWQDGKVAAQMGEDFVQLSRAATAAANSVLKQVATAQNVWYVDLVTPFLGSGDDDDDTPLLAPDGDHPDAAGHQVIATAILQAVPSLLQPLG